MDIFPWTHLTDCPRQNFTIGDVCLSVGSFVHYKMEKWDILLSFRDIFMKIGGHLLTGISHRLANTTF